MTRQTIKIYTDGACKGNPGPGGAAFVVTLTPFTEVDYVYSQSFTEETTNNRMEMWALYQALRYSLSYINWDIEIYTDSALIVNTFNQKWYENWERNGWKNSKKEPVANSDLWKEILGLYRVQRVQIIKVKGHGNNIFNNTADKLAQAAAEGARKTVV